MVIIFHLILHYSSYHFLVQYPYITLRSSELPPPIPSLCDLSVQILEVHVRWKAARRLLKDVKLQKPQAQATCGVKGFCFPNLKPNP